LAKADIMLFGKRYSVACSPGQEPRLEALGAELDTRLKTIAEAVGDVGEDRLLLVAALSLLDELEAARSGPNAELEGEIARVFIGAASRIDALIDRIYARSAILPDLTDDESGDPSHAQ